MGREPTFERNERSLSRIARDGARASLVALIVLVGSISLAFIATHAANWHVSKLAGDTIRPSGALSDPSIDFELGIVQSILPGEISRWSTSPRLTDNSDGLCPIGQQSEPMTFGLCRWRHSERRLYLPVWKGFESRAPPSFS